MFSNIFPVSRISFQYSSLLRKEKKKKHPSLFSFCPGSSRVGTMLLKVVRRPPLSATERLMGKISSPTLIPTGLGGQRCSAASDRQIVGPSLSLWGANKHFFKSNTYIYMPKHIPFTICCLWQLSPFPAPRMLWCSQLVRCHQRQALD